MKDEGVDRPDDVSVGVRDTVMAGVVAGAAGGGAFGAAMLEVGSLETVASLVRSNSPVIGFVVHLVVAVAIGVGFGFLTRSLRPDTGEIVIWGLAYGAFWWFVGAVTLLPILTGQPIAWELDAARPFVPSLFGHLLYGAVAGTTISVVWRRRQTRQVGLTAAAAIRGGAAWLVGAAILGLILDRQFGRPMMSTAMGDSGRPVAWIVTILIGTAAGVGFASLYPLGIHGAGPTLVRGMSFGFLVWVVVALSLLPVVRGRGLLWSVDDLQTSFGTLPGYLLWLGAVPALLYHWLSPSADAVDVDGDDADDSGGLGTKSRVAVVWGVAAGLAGGLAFTILMLQIGYLPTVASMVGAGSSAAGLFVHLVIAMMIGVGYAFAFARRSNDLASALGWGTSYGVFWWLMGPLTLAPMLLGEHPEWTVAAARAAYPSLIGHLAYGALVGLVFFRLEFRHDPWWISRNDAEEARSRRATEQLRTSAPALWVLTVLIALVVPLLAA